MYLGRSVRRAEVVWGRSPDGTGRNGRWLALLALDPRPTRPAGVRHSQASRLTLGTARCFAPPEPDPLDRLIDESHPLCQRLLRAAGRALAVSYGITLVLGLAVLPLTAARYHLASP